MMFLIKKKEIKNLIVYNIYNQLIIISMISKFYSMYFKKVLTNIK